MSLTRRIVARVALAGVVLAALFTAFAAAIGLR